MAYCKARKIRIESNGERAKRCGDIDIPEEDAKILCQNCIHFEKD